MKVLGVIVFLCCIISCNANHKLPTAIGGVSTNYIRTEWQKDICAATGTRDSIVQILIEKQALFGLNEGQIKKLFGKPHHSELYKKDVLIDFVVLGAYLYDDKKQVIGCDTTVTPKMLYLKFDSVYHKIYYARVVEE